MTDKFDELAKEREYREKLGAELQRFIDDSRAPHKYAILDEDALEDEVLDLRTMGIAPFLSREAGDDDDV